MYAINTKLIKVIITGIIIILVSLTIQTTPQTAFNEKAFVACVGNTVKLYSIAEDGTLFFSREIARGTEIKLTGNKKRVDENELNTAPSVVVIEDEGRSTASGGDIKSGDVGGGNDTVLVELKNHGNEGKCYIDEKNVTENPRDIVREREVYVRTPATVYENSRGPRIAGFAHKGTELKVVGYDKVGTNGSVNMYEVELSDARESKEESSKHETPTGFVYGKYMAFTQEEANSPYNENGEYDKAKKAKYGMELYGGEATGLDYYPVDKPKLKDNRFCDSARTMYLNYYAAYKNDSYIELIKESGCNAVVIDVKSGGLSYKSKVAKKWSPTAYENAPLTEEEFVTAVKKFKQELSSEGIYTIGRITCFSDPNYAEDHPEDCIETESSYAAWPSAYSRDVWEYNVELAIEAVELMDFDEIQFDYVRFPEASYNLSKSGADFKNKYGEQKAQAVQNFCFYATDQVHEAGAYVSVDVFGECSDGYVTAYGQYWPAISNVVDAISSMPYTDHYGHNDTWSEPRIIMGAWAAKAAEAQKQIPTPAAARTWITGYDTPYWNPSVNYGEEKLREQIDALEEAGLTGGFIPWNSASPIEKYREYQGIWSDGQKRLD